MLRIWNSSVIIISLFLLLAPPTWASNAYVTDSFRISLRRGPSIENKILKFLPSGLPVEVLKEEDGWSHVLIKEDEEEAIKGWVLSRYLVTRLPWKEQTERLQKENGQMQKKMGELEKQLTELHSKDQNQANQLKNQTAKLEKALQDYQQLKKESASYLQLKSDFEVTNEKLEALSIQNELLKNDQTHRWLGIGAAIVIVGFFIGLRIGMKQKKYRSSTYLK